MAGVCGATPLGCRRKLAVTRSAVLTLIRHLLAVSAYGQLAKQLGNPRASRAVGAANGRNPVSIIVPCHRVIGSSGKLTGFAGGLERKTYLLNLEGKRQADPREMRVDN